jgi:thiol-disulfide isomerase/thioredoxin
MKVAFLSLIFGMLAMLNFSGCGKNSIQNSVKATPADEPLVTLTDLQGNNFSLASFKGKVVFVDFWATWCEGCQDEMPSLIELQKQYGDKGFTILGVAMDVEGKRVVEPFVQKMRYKTDTGPAAMNFPIAIGNDDIAKQFGGFIGMPAVFLISREGKIAKKYLGVTSQDSLEKEIKSLL